MIYVVDTSSLIVAGHYYPERFPSFWEDLGRLVVANRLLSVSEVLKELDDRSTSEHLAAWTKRHRRIFSTPTAVEMAFVAKIFAVPRFQDLIKKKDRLKGKPVADPFLISRAANLHGCVVSQERDRTDAIKIPTVCAHFGVKCVDLEEMMAREKFRY